MAKTFRESSDLGEDVEREWFDKLDFKFAAYANEDWGDDIYGEKAYKRLLDLNDDGKIMIEDEGEEFEYEVYSVYFSAKSSPSGRSPVSHDLPWSEFVRLGRPKHLIVRSSLSYQVCDKNAEVPEGNCYIELYQTDFDSFPDKEESEA